MKNKDTRKRKLKLLQAIKEGKLSIENLQPPKIYIFKRSNLNPGIYEMNGKEYNEIEYREFCKIIKNRNNNSIIWNEGKTYTKEDMIITLRYTNPQNSVIKG